MWYLYKHTNKTNGKVYIGKATNPQSRWENQGYKYKTCPRFWSAIQHYGWDNFEHEILLACETQEEINILEKEYIKKYRALEPDFGYNLSEGGTGGNVWAGKTQAEKEAYAEKQRQETLSRGQEWHDKLSKAQLKRWANPQARQELGNKVRGGKNGYAKKCRCIETNKIYDSYADAAEDCGQARAHGSKIGMVIRGERTIFAGYHWEAVE